MLPFFSVLHSVSGWEEERQSGDSDSGEYWKGWLQKTSSFTGEMERVYWKEGAAERGEGWLNPLSYLYSNRKSLLMVSGK